LFKNASKTESRIEKIKLELPELPKSVPPRVARVNRKDQLQQMLQENPDDPFLLYALALEDRSGGNEEAALTGLRQVLTVDSQYVAAYFQLGQLLAGMGRQDEARTSLQQGINVADQVGDSHAAGEMREFLGSLT
jgi:thioredoxin-like negative regulator of GroEL